MDLYIRRDSIDTALDEINALGQYEVKTSEAKPYLRFIEARWIVTGGVQNIPLARLDYSGDGPIKVEQLRTQKFQPDDVTEMLLAIIDPKYRVMPPDVHGT